MNEMTRARHRFFEQVRSGEPQAELRGADAGLNGLGSEAFEKLARADLKGIIEESGVRQPTGTLMQQLDQLQKEKNTVEERKRQLRENWLSMHERPSGSQQAFDFRRLLSCSLVAAAIGLVLRLAGTGQRWETWALLGVCAALLGLGPWGTARRAKAGFAGLLQFAAHIGDCLRAGWIGSSVAWRQRALRRMELRAATLDRWEQAGFDVLMRRFDREFERGELAARLANPKGGS